MLHSSDLGSANGSRSSRPPTSGRNERAARRSWPVGRLILAATLGVLLGIAHVAAQTYPSRPITIVVALPAGGGVDALARLLAEHMKTTLGQPIIVENMGGAGGTLSIGRIVRSAPDGYTIGMGTLGQYVISGAVYTLPFDMLKDLEPVALLPSVPYWMVVRKDLPANNLKELASWLKANKASASTTGTASLARFCGMAFQEATGTHYQFVPYRGGAQSLADLVGGQIDLSCDLAANSLAQDARGQHQSPGSDEQRRAGRRRPMCRPPRRPDFPD